MKKFLVLYTSPLSAKDQMAKATPEQAIETCQPNVRGALSTAHRN